MGFYCLVLIYNWFFFSIFFHKAAAKRIVVVKIWSPRWSSMHSNWLCSCGRSIYSHFGMNLSKFVINVFLKKKICSTLFIYVFNKCIIWSRKIYWKDLFSFLIRSNSWRFISRKCLVKTRRKQTAIVARIINQQDFFQDWRIFCVIILMSRILFFTRWLNGRR